MAQGHARLHGHTATTRMGMAGRTRLEPDPDGRQYLAVLASLEPFLRARAWYCLVPGHVRRALKFPARTLILPIYAPV